MHPTDSSMFGSICASLTAALFELSSVYPTHSSFNAKSLINRHSSTRNLIGSSFLSHLYASLAPASLDVCSMPDRRTLLHFELYSSTLQQSIPSLSKLPRT
eukprot:scaffold21715_cov114-Skeletonema_marinoi.AAC.6